MTPATWRKKMMAEIGERRSRRKSSCLRGCIMRKSMDCRCLGREKGRTRLQGILVRYRPHGLLCGTIMTCARQCVSGVTEFIYVFCYMQWKHIGLNGVFICFDNRNTYAYYQLHSTQSFCPSSTPSPFSPPICSRRESYRNVRDTFH